MPRADLRVSAASELRSRGVAKSEIEDKPSITGTSALALLMGAVPPPTKTDEEQRYERLSPQDSESLRGLLDWYKIDGSTAYQLLAERGEIPKDIVRKDLLSRFQRIQNESDHVIENAFGPELASKHRQEFEEFREFLVERYTGGALAALAIQPATEDVDIARQFLNSDRTRVAALRIIASKGTDLNELIEIAKSSFGEQRKLALDGVRRLAVDKLETARTLIASEVRELRLAALPLIDRLSDEHALPLLENLLSHDDTNLRIAAVAQLYERLEQEHLAQLLDRYIDAGSYFYDVVVWLDRLIYAPEPILRYYKDALDRKLEAMNS